MKRRDIFMTITLAVLIGTITDKTTGQPLEGITVTTTAGSHTLQTRTDTAGHFMLRGIGNGTYTLHFSSRDVPAQSAQVRAQGASTHVTLEACSTTLDYTCGDSSGGG
jgi:CarboxypepD_reg-like domain